MIFFAQPVRIWLVLKILMIFYIRFHWHITIQAQRELRLARKFVLFWLFICLFNKTVCIILSYKCLRTNSLEGKPVTTLLYLQKNAHREIFHFVSFSLRLLKVTSQVFGCLLWELFDFEKYIFFEMLVLARFFTLY